MGVLGFLVLLKDGETKSSSHPDMEDTLTGEKAAV